MNTVIDASSLIIIARVNGLQTLYNIYGVVAVTPAVFDEVVVAGEQLDKTDPASVRIALEKGWLAQTTLSSAEETLVESLRRQHRGLGLGEAESLACAEKRQWLLLVEERKAKAVAKARNVNYSIIQLVPFQGYLRRQITAQSCLELMDKIAMEMGTDLAVLNVLKVAISTLEQERKR